MIRPIPSAEVIAEWPNVVEHLRKVPRPGYELEDILARLVARDAQLWIAGDPVMAAVVTELNQLPRQLVCTVWLCGGENVLKWWEPMKSTIIKWAKDNGCSAVEIIGRPGWERLLKVNRTQVVMRLELENG